MGKISYAFAYSNYLSPNKQAYTYMGLTGKLIMISSGGDVFYDILKHKPEEIAFVSPDKVHSCDIEGQRGVIGSVLCWNYTLDGKRQTTKEIIEEVDEKKHKIVKKVIEGDLLGDLYKSFKIIFHVQPKGDRQLAVWTLEFEKLNASVPYPTTFMDLLLNVTKEMGVHKTRQ
ncbi:hypothetical protein OSB04_008950 [Centaurea solstitialis]|uniref:Bet v I/Major latex protein domain-containing protein n=1 Tax=Centaurea solstitialis TaxID=347529 RepID=A0AA38TMR6_9ASTR|nr:hypothetical protein OSB04_008950 [Centaurea solstitialis]